MPSVVCLQNDHFVTMVGVLTPTLLVFIFKSIIIISKSNDVSFFVETETY